MITNVIINKRDGLRLFKVHLFPMYTIIQNSGKGGNHIGYDCHLKAYNLHLLLKLYPSASSSGGFPSSSKTGNSQTFSAKWQRSQETCHWML